MSAILMKSAVGQAERYFEKELVNRRENYYSEEDANAGRWTGGGAAALGLEGIIKKEDFSRLSRGINPATGRRFRRMTLSRTRETAGELIRVKEIAGWDLVISAPKSVSIAALIGGDGRVRRAHDESVTDALARAERQAQANLGGGKKEQTGSLIVGRFSHDAARPGGGGFVAPQLHDHCFIMNATHRADGTLKPLESLELHRAQSYIRSVYYTGLADRLQKLGYAVEIDKKTGAPEIAGISKEYRQACAPRRADILELAKKAGKNFRQLGLVNRREKVFDAELIREQHRGIDGLFDYQAGRLVEAAKRNLKPAGNNAAAGGAGEAEEAKEAVTFALAKLARREAVFAPRRLLLEANNRGIGRTSVAAIEAELETRRRFGQVGTLRLGDGREAAYAAADENSAANEKVEKDSPPPIKILKPAGTLRDEYYQNIAPGENAALEREFAKLAFAQKEDVVEILNADTGIATLEGRAGAGKTVTLEWISRMAEKAHYEVVGLAPTIGAARELETARISSSTLQKLLTAKETPREGKRLYIVDESSFVSFGQMDKFFREAVETGDRVLLVGETRRREGDAEAGKPSARSEREKLTAGEELTAGAEIETVQRQGGTSRKQSRTTERRTLRDLPAEKIVEAVSEMRERGQVVEVPTQTERHRAIVRAFVAAPEKSLVVAPRSTDREAINSQIHAALKDAGKIGQAEIEVKILRPRDELTGIERESAAAYREGDIISYRRGSAEHKIAAQTQARVVKTDREQNLLTVEIKDAEDGTQVTEITYNPKRLRGVSVWTEDKIKVGEGERVQFRAPLEAKKTKIAGGAIFEVGKITADALTLKDGKGKIVILDTKKPQAIDYGYAAASHSSPGKTLDRVLIHAETSETKENLNEKIAAVAVSRTRDKALIVTIFTDDADKLAGKIARQIEKSEIIQVKAETVGPAPPVTDIKLPAGLPVAAQLAMPEIEISPAQQKGDVPVAKPEVERAGGGEINQPAVLPLAEKAAMPEVPLAPIRAAPAALDGQPELPDGRPELPKNDRCEIKPPVNVPFVGTSPPSEIKTQPPEKTIARTVEPAAAPPGRDEIQPPATLPAARGLPMAEMKSPQQQKIADIANRVNPGRETLIKEVLQMSRDSLVEQGVEPEPEVWKRFARTIIEELPDRAADEDQIQLLESYQRFRLPSERLSLEGKSSLEATHIILKLALRHQRDKFIKSSLAGYEKEIAAERREIVIKPETERRGGVTDGAIVKPEIEAGRGDQVTLQTKIAEPDITAAESAIKIGELEPVAAATPGKPEQFEQVGSERVIPEPVKPAPRVRNFEAGGREELIRELVIAARNEARAWTGEDFTYKQEKRLTKMYRVCGDVKPPDKQIGDLNKLQERFSEPIPPPKNFIEATVLKLDNLTDAEKSVGLRGQITQIDKIIKGEEAERLRIEEARGQSAEDDVFGRTDSYFTQRLHRFETAPERKSYYQLMNEAQERRLTPAYSVNEEIQERNTQNALYQMGIANALQEQIKRSLDEQGIKLEPMTQRIINNSVDLLATQPPSVEEYRKAEEISRSLGITLVPATKLEARAYVLTHGDEAERDRYSSALAAAAGAKAAEIKSAAEENLKRERVMTQEDEGDYKQSRGRSM